jgi:hypothetical protein
LAQEIRSDDTEATVRVAGRPGRDVPALTGRTARLAGPSGAVREMIAARWRLACRYGHGRAAV